MRFFFAHRQKSSVKLLLVAVLTCSPLNRVGLCKTKKRKVSIFYCLLCFPFPVSQTSLLRIFSAIFEWQKRFAFRRVSIVQTLISAYVSQALFSFSVPFFLMGGEQYSNRKSCSWVCCAPQLLQSREKTSCVLRTLTRENRFDPKTITFHVWGTSILSRSKMRLVDQTALLYWHWARPVR